MIRRRGIPARRRPDSLVPRLVLAFMVAAALAAGTASIAIVASDLRGDPCGGKIR